MRVCSFKPAWRRREISDDLAARAFAALLAAPVRRRAPHQLYREAWRVADELGWAKTHDAEYVALARILGCRLLTLDERLRRGAGRFVDIVGPAADARLTPALRPGAS